MTKEIPILFSTDMVQAILAGRKTMTRRMVKLKENDSICTGSYVGDMKPWPVCYNTENWMKCPYGKPGDLLWVRETWRKYAEVDSDGFTQYDKQVIEYAADNPEPMNMVDGDGFQMYNSDGTEKMIPFKPSIHMPKEAARIWLRVTDVRVERLQDISEEDVKAEGITEKNGLFEKVTGSLTTSAKSAFRSLWRSINGRESWDANPWVWVVSFEVISTTGKPY